MAPSTPRCDDDRAFVLCRLPIAVVCAALLGCGAQAGATSTDAAASNTDARGGEEGAIDFDVLAFDLYVPDAIEESLDAGEEADARCAPPDGSCASMTDCCPPPSGTIWNCVLCMQASCRPSICNQ